MQWPWPWIFIVILLLKFYEMSSNSNSSNKLEVQFNPNLDEDDEDSEEYLMLMDQLCGHTSSSLDNLFQKNSIDPDDDLKKTYHEAEIEDNDDNDLPDLILIDPKDGNVFINFNSCPCSELLV